MPCSAPILIVPDVVLAQHFSEVQNVLLLSPADWKTSEEGKEKRTNINFNHILGISCSITPDDGPCRIVNETSVTGRRESLSRNDAAFTNGTEAQNKELWFGRIKYARRCKIYAVDHDVPKHWPPDSVCSTLGLSQTNTNTLIWIY